MLPIRQGRIALEALLKPLTRIVGEKSASSAG